MDLLFDGKGEFVSSKECNFCYGEGMYWAYGGFNDTRGKLSKCGPCGGTGKLLEPTYEEKIKEAYEEGDCVQLKLIAMNLLKLSGRI